MIHAMIKKKHQAGKDRGPARGRYPLYAAGEYRGPAQIKARKYGCEMLLCCAFVPVPPVTPGHGIPQMRDNLSRCASTSRNSIKVHQPWQTPNCSNRSKKNSGHEIFKVAWCKTLLFPNELCTGHLIRRARIHMRTSCPQSTRTLRDTA